MPLSKSKPSKPMAARIAAPQVCGGSELRRPLRPTPCLFGAGRPMPTHPFDKSAPREHSRPAPTEAHCEIRARRGIHAQPTQGQRQFPVPTVRDPHRAHTTLHSPGDLRHATAMWWQSHRSPLQLPQSSAAFRGQDSRNHRSALDLRDEVDRGSRREGASGKPLAMSGHAHEPHPVHPLVRPVAAAYPKVWHFHPATNADLSSCARR